MWAPEPRSYDEAHDAKELEFLFDIEQYFQFQVVRPNLDDTKVILAILKLLNAIKGQVGKPSKPSKQ